MNSWNYFFANIKINLDKSKKIITVIRDPFFNVVAAIILFEIEDFKLIQLIKLRFEGLNLK
jgi:hypothetical protein